MTDLAEFEETLKEISERGGEEMASEWMKNIECEFGRAPLIFKRMAERPEVLISHLLYKGTVTRTSSMEPKYVELISMAVGAALKCHTMWLSHAGGSKKGATLKVSRHSYFRLISIHPCLLPIVSLMKNGSLLSCEMTVCRIGVTHKSALHPLSFFYLLGGDKALCSSL
jgi:alkylhydroperoxidase/carboxymuconolactone decarboxylase family protein YurZ